jgi:hypothetical protein
MVKEWRTRRLSRRYVLFFVSMLGVLAFAATAAGQLPGSDFESGDGNLVESTGKDWASASVGIDCESASKVGCALDKPTGSTDDSFGQGTSENTEPPTPTEGSIPNNKSDLSRFYVFSEKANAKDFLYLAWERVQEPNGTTNMDFEFNQSKTLSSNGVTPERSQDDLLIKYDLSQGGTNPTLGYHRWETADGNSGATTPQQISAICEAGNKFPCWGKGQTLNGNTFQGAINSSEVVDPIDPDAPRTLSARTFGEAGINLTDSNLFPAGECINYGSAYLKSRSSDSFTSEIKDFIAPIAVDVSNCGGITIKKQTNPQLGSSSPDFPFTATGGANPSSFNLKDDGSQPYSDLLAGSYTFTEGALPTGWEFDRIECTKDGNSTITENETGGARNVVIVLEADDDVECTFYNRKTPQLTVVKKIVGGNGTTDSFDVKVDGTTKINNAVSTAAAGTSVGPFDVTDGSHTVSETLGDGTTAVPTADWTIAFSGDCNSSGVVSVTYGESKTCTVTNTKKAKLTVIKKIVGGNGTTDTFDVKVDGTTKIDDAYSTAAAGTSEGPFEVSIGSHTVSETLGDGTTAVPTSNWTIAFSGDCNSSGVVSVTYGDSKTCTITNTKKATLTVNKVCVPSNDDGKFDLQIDGSIAGTGDDASCGGTTGAVVVSVGSHTASEAAGTGTNLADYTSVIGGDCAANGTVSLAAGESKTCTITNTRRKFTIVAFVCETTSGTPVLYKSTVTLPQPGGTSKTTTTAVLSGSTAAAMCGAAANYPGLNTGDHDARISIGTSPAP